MNYVNPLGELLVISRNNNAYVCLGNGFGSIYTIIDSACNIVNYYDYTPAGGTECAGESFSNRFRFAGMPYDTEVDAGDSGKLTARYFDPNMGGYFRPSMGAYMNRANAGGLNLYSYWKRDESFPIIPNNPGMTYPWYWFTPPPPPGPPAPKVNDPEEKVGKQDDNNGNNVDDVQGNGDPKPQPPEPNPPVNPDQWLQDLHERIKKANAEYLMKWEMWLRTPVGQMWQQQMKNLSLAAKKNSGVQAGSTSQRGLRLRELNIDKDRIRLIDRRCQRFLQLFGKEIDKCSWKWSWLGLPDISDKISVGVAIGDTVANSAIGNNKNWLQKLGCPGGKGIGAFLSATTVWEGFWDIGIMMRAAVSTSAQARREIPDPNER